MYYLIYGLLKLISLLPLRLLYVIADIVYLILNYVVRYRKSVVRSNLAIAFPHLSEKERDKIINRFYHNFSDTFIEIVKMLSWSKTEVQKRFKGNIEVLNQWKGKEQSIQVITGHFFNWELANLAVSSGCEIPFLGVYKPLTSKTMNRLFLKLRKRFGTILIPTSDFKHHVHEHLKNQYALILVADQNPSNASMGWWLHFFSRPAPFVQGPAKGAIQRNTIIIYADFYKVRRGYYEVVFEAITTEPTQYSEPALTYLLAKKIESSVIARPDNYLWTHKRWKHQWQAHYAERWADQELPSP